MKFKGCIKGISGIILAAVMCNSAISYAADIHLVVGGENITSVSSPIIVKDRTMVPYRSALEAMGAKVSYDESTGVITSVKNNHTMKLTVGSDIMNIDGKEIKLEQSVFARDNTIYIPIRACARAFDMDVEWVHKTQTVKIRKKVSLPVEINGKNFFCKNTYDDSGNLVYSERSDGSWEKYEYNENGDVTSFESSIGYWYKNTYNENGIIVSCKGEGDDWTDKKYDEKGNVIYSTDGDIYTKYEYNSQGQILYSETTYYDGKQYSKYTYENGKCVYVEHSDGWKKMTYDEDGRLLMTEYSDGNCEKTTYDKNGNPVYCEHSGGGYIRYEYDEYGNCIYKESPSASGGTYSIKYTYDKENNLIKSEDSSGTVTIYEVFVK